MCVTTPQDQRSRRLVWLLPAALALHIVEEYVGGFPGWVTHVLGGSFNNPAFAANNAGFMAIMLALTAWASQSGSRLAAFMLVAFASGNIFWDGLFHIVMTAALDRYSPGLVTASVLYMPLSRLTGASVLRSRVLRLQVFLAAVATGAALLAFVIWYGLFHFAL